MPYPEYMQDFLEMIEDPECLIQLRTSPKKKKVDGGGGGENSPLDAVASISPSTRLISRSGPRPVNIPLSAETTLEMMQLLDGWQENKPTTENTEYTTPALLPSVSASIQLSNPEGGGILEKGELPSTTNNMSPPAATSNTEPSITIPDPKAMDISSPSELSQAGLFVNPVPTLLLDEMSAEDNIDVDLESRLRFSSATTLATRTTEDVIADLKRLRPAQDQDPSKRRRSAVSDIDTITLSTVKPSGAQNSPPLEGEQEDYDEEEEVDVVGPATKPRKITERKRRMNATIDNYVMNRTLDKIKKGTVVRPEDEANQTTRWLVNQSENRQIISTPREYQNELFQRAKEKNIIAVLDTGK